MKIINKFMASHERVYVAVFWMCLIQLFAILISIWIGSHQMVEFETLKTRIDKLEKVMQESPQGPSKM